MNPFTVVKYGADLKPKVKSRVEARVMQVEAKPTIGSKRNKGKDPKEPSTEAQEKLAAKFAGQKRGTEDVDRTVS